MTFSEWKGATYCPSIRWTFTPRYLYHVNLLPYNVARAVQDSFCRTGSQVIENFQQVRNLSSTQR